MRKSHNIGYVNYTKKNSVPCDSRGVRLHKGDLVGCASSSLRLPYSPTYVWMVVGFCSDCRFVVVVPYRGSMWFAKVPSCVLVKIEAEV